MSKEQVIPCKIVLTRPFPGTTYGLQNGTGNSYITTQRQVAENTDLIFYVDLAFKENKLGRLVWHGPIVQGPPDKAFLYLDVGSYAGQIPSLVNGRIKIPLPSLTDVSDALIQIGCTFSTRITATNEKDGKPAFGTVKPFDGWEVGSSHNNLPGA